MLKKLTRVFLALLTITAVGLAAVAFLLPRGFMTAGTVKAVFDPAKTAFGKKRSLNILLLGVDYNYDSKAQRYTTGARSDTILIVRVEPLGKQLAMMSLPRDLYVGIGKNASYGYERINAAYSYGGEKLTIETVERITGLKIDHYVVVKSDVVKKLVDAVGGVPIKVEKQMDWDDNWAGLHIHLKPGDQRLSGAESVGYCRFRHDEEGDFGRIRRQQHFIGALIKELKRPTNFLKVKQFAAIVKSEMKTDLSQDQLVALANIYRSFPLQNIAKGRPQVVDFFANGAALLSLAPGEPAECIRQIFTDLPNPAVKDVHVIIEAGPSKDLEAEQLASGLRHEGFPSVRLLHLPDDIRGASAVSVSGLSDAELQAVREVFSTVKVTTANKKGPPTATLRLAGPVYLSSR